MKTFMYFACKQVFLWKTPNNIIIVICDTSETRENSRHVLLRTNTVIIDGSLIEVNLTT